MQKLTEKQVADIAPVIRELIMHENELVNQRIGWLVQAQGLLFATLAFAWAEAPRALTLVLSVLGTAVALSLWTALRMYSPAVRGRVNWLAERLPEGIELDEVLVIGRRAESRGLGKIMRPWRALPMIFVLGWLAVAAIALFH